MAGLNSLTFGGNLVADPDYRVTATGTAVCNLRIAVTDRRKDGTGKWVDGDKLFINGAVWGETADNVKASLRAGMEVIICGKLRQRQYRDKEGAKREVMEMDIQKIGVTLGTQTAVVTKAGASRGRASNPAEAAQAGDPWQSEHAVLADQPDPFNTY